MGIFESTERFPVIYKTGDHALVIAWCVSQHDTEHTDVAAVLCLEDGRAVIAKTNEFTFDYRYSHREQRWFDVSRIEEVDPEGEPDADTDQEDADDGGPGVP